MLKNLALGDVFGISTNSGIGFIQFVSDTEDNCELIRVLIGLYESYEDISEEIIKQKERYFLHFPLRSAFKKKLIHYIGNYNIPQNVIIPRYFRSQTVHPKTNSTSWYIFEEDICKMKHIEVLSNEIIALSDWSVWNDTLLKERLEQNWALEDWR